MTKFVETPVTNRSLAQRKLVFGKGINDANYLLSYKVDNKTQSCPYYVVWKSMLRRCYSPLFHIKQSTYIDCSVCNSWLTFSNFKSWMMLQDWVGKQLDKDILEKGNKEYSPENCIFVTSQLNVLLKDTQKVQGDYGLGVYWNTEKRKFKASYRNRGIEKFLGYFVLEKDAIQAYCFNKAKYIKEIAEEQSELKLKNALINRANDLLLTI